VVPNVVNSVFTHEDAQEELVLPELRSPSLFFPTRAYRHKNLPFLGLVGHELLVSHGCRVTFVLTLTASEWESLPHGVREFSVNLGPLRISQIPAVFRGVDAAIFPSLLESQSATPFEALTAGCPLLASDRPFVRGVVGDAAWYFDPHDPASAAASVQALLTNGPERERRRRRGLELMASWPTARDRACAYLDVISEELTLLEGTRPF
jgi:glycosyltransferase involved in cell wall biosynthesis